MLLASEVYKTQERRRPSPAKLRRQRNEDTAARLRRALAAPTNHIWHIIELISIPPPSDLHSPLPIRGVLRGVNIEILQMEMERMDIASAFAF